MIIALLLAMLCPSSFSGPEDQSELRELNQPSPSQSSLIEANPNQTSLSENKPDQINRNHIKPKVAIIIDDLGYKLREGQESIELPHPLTLAIIPGSPHSRTLAESANCRDNKEILVHLPMTPENRRSWEPGLNPKMSEREFEALATKLLNSVPHAIGANNHGGSLLTRNRERMDWLMDILNTQSLFFVDSRTTPLSVAKTAASMANVPFSARDIFLDNVRDEAAIKHQLDALIALAMKNGQAVAIGHPHKETLLVLTKYLPQIQQEGVELVGISRLLTEKRKIEHEIPQEHAAEPSTHPAQLWPLEHNITVDPSQSPACRLFC